MMDSKRTRSLRKRVRRFLRPTASGVDRRRHRRFVEIVTLMMTVTEMTLSEIARRSRAFRPQVGFRDHLKAIYRFLSNHHFETQPVAQYLIQRAFLEDFIHQRRWILLFDWSDFVRYQVLRLSLVLGGRALTLDEWVLPLNTNKEALFEGIIIAGRPVHSQPEFEQRALLEFFQEKLLPLASSLHGKHLVLVADRGLGSVGFLLFVQTLRHRPQLKSLFQHIRFDYVIRLKGDAFIELVRGQLSPNLSIHYTGVPPTAKVTRHLLSLPLAALAIRRNSEAFLRKVRYRKDRALTTNIAISHQALAGITREESTWYLATSFAKLKPVVGIYYQRMQIEESFRDTKGHHHRDWMLQKIRLKTPERALRLLLCVRVAYYLLLLFGLWIAKKPHWVRTIALFDNRTATGASLSFFGLARMALEFCPETIKEFQWAPP